MFELGTFQVSIMLTSVVLLLSILAITFTLDTIRGFKKNGKLVNIILIFIIINIWLADIVMVIYTVESYSLWLG